MFENSAIDTTFFLNSKKYSWLPKMLHFHVHNKVSLKAEHIDLSKPLFITLKVCINFRFSNLNLAQCWLWLLVIQHSLLRRKATLIFCLKDYALCDNLGDCKIFLACTKALGPPAWHPSYPGPRPHKCLQSYF